MPRHSDKRERRNTPDRSLSFRQASHPGLARIVTHDCTEGFRREFDLLRPQDIGVTLTEEMMMEPEASVSAIVMHHPDAKYFSAGKEYLQ